MSYPPLTLGDGVRIGPAVAVAPGAAVGHGTHVDQDTVIGPSARLGSFVRVSSGVRVAPNAEVGDHSTLAPCCAVDGLVGRNCRLGRDVAVAAGARVVDGVQLNAGVRVRSDTPASSGSLASLTTPSKSRTGLLVGPAPFSGAFWLRSVSRFVRSGRARRRFWSVEPQRHHQVLLAAVARLAAPWWSDEQWYALPMLLPSRNTVLAFATDDGAVRRAEAAFGEPARELTAPTQGT